LAPYKYAGYPQLLQTIELEKDDDNLFSKPYPLLPSARYKCRSTSSLFVLGLLVSFDTKPFLYSACSELCYYTVHASSLNAEEMRREGGIKV
jgi:DnaJ family protein C protein 13